jgi:hypothetical protein
VSGTRFGIKHFSGRVGQSMCTLGAARVMGSNLTSGFLGTRLVSAVMHALLGLVAGQGSEFGRHTGALAFGGP